MDTVVVDGGFSNPNAVLAPPNSVGAVGEVLSTLQTDEMSVVNARTGLIPPSGELLGVEYTLWASHDPILAGKWALTSRAGDTSGNLLMVPFASGGNGSFDTIIFGGPTDPCSLTTDLVRTGRIGALLSARDCSTISVVAFDALLVVVYYRVPAPWPRTSRLNRRTSRT